MSDLTFESTYATSPAGSLPRVSDVHKTFRDLVARAGIEPAARRTQILGGGISVFLLGAGLPLIEVARFIG